MRSAPRLDCGCTRIQFLHDTLEQTLVVSAMFEVNRALLNPKFEGYKFKPLDQDKVISRYTLPYTPTQTTVSGRSPLAFQEVQSRIRHNHLAIGPNGRASYVDAELKVIGVTLGDVSH